MRTKLDNKTTLLYVIALFISFMISTWVDVREAVINPDGICYLFSAEIVGTEGIEAAMHLCPQAKWPFYSLLIYGMSAVTHLDALNAAFVLDALLSCFTVAAFIAIAKQLGGNLRVMIFAAAVILLSHEFNILRQDVIRDHGFWAAYLISMWCLLRFFATRAFSMAIWFSVSLIVATCFRIEGAIFLLALPFAAWFERGQSFTKRLSAFIQLNSVLIVGSAVVGSYLATHPDYLNQLGRLPEVVRQLHSGLEMMIGKYQSTREAVSHAVLTHASMRDAGLVVVLLMLAWYIVNVIGNLSLVYSFLVIYAWFTRAVKFVTPGKLVVASYLFVNVFVTFGFFAENHFLAKRYLIAMSLVLMLWVPFILDYLYTSKRSLHRILLAVTGMVIVVSGIASLFHFGHSKLYIRQAGDWLATNIPIDAKIYTNDYQLMYYSQHIGKHIFEKYEQFKDVHVIADGRWQAYDYLALIRGTEGDHETAMIMQELHMAPIAVFVSSNGSHIYIYKVPHRGK
jgi:hypothetical protein